MSARPDPEFSKRKTRKTRREKLGADSLSAKLPSVDKGSYLLEWLFEIGPVESGANGPEPLSWVEINAWKQATGTNATHEELSIIRTMSLEYVGQMHGGEDPKAPDPCRVRAEPHDIEASMKGLLRNRRKK